MAIRGDENHPGLKNLVSIKDSEMADEWRKRGLEVRRKNKEKRELAKQTIVDSKGRIRKEGKETNEYSMAKDFIERFWYGEMKDNERVKLISRYKP